MKPALSFLTARLCAALALAVLVCARGGPAAAAPDPETDEELRNELLAGQTVGEWNSTLKVVLDRPGGQVGDILGELFTTPEHAKRLDLLAAVSSHLVRQPKVLLAGYILRRAMAPDGSAFLARLQEPLEPERGNGKRRPDWDRLQNAAAEILAQPTDPVADREAAIAFLVREQGARLDWVLSIFEAEARRQASVAAPTPEDARLSAALCAALKSLLAYPFESPAQAARLLEETKALGYVERLKHFSNRKDAGAEDRDLARKYLREAIARADTPVALSQAAGDAGRYPDLLAEALRRAGELKPRPIPEWADFFATVLGKATEPDLVLAALDRLAESGFGGGPGECCSPVADAIQARLAARMPPDPAPVRVRLVQMLGDLASLGAVARQVEAALRRRTPGADEVPEWVELVLAVGKCQGVVVDVQLKPFYTLPEPSPEAREALRTAVARALGREGVRKSDGAAAVLALMGILGGNEGWERAALPKVRVAALRSLGAYPGAETANLLLGIAEGSGAESENEAQLALQTLGTMTSAGAGRHHGASALVAFLQRTKGRSDVEARRMEALKAVKLVKNVTSSEPVPAEVRDAVSAVLRETLKEGSEAERTQAARTATDLAEPSALSSLVAWWAEQPVGARTDLLRALLEAVARAPAPKEPPPAGMPDPDALVAEALRGVSKVQPSTAVEWAEALARNGARAAAPRTLLLVAHAEALLDRAASAEPGLGGRAKRREDLVAARAILTPAHGGARAPEEAEQTRRVLIDVLERLALEVEGAEDSKALLLEAVSMATGSTVSTAHQTGIRIAERLLNEEPLRASLSAQERADLEKQVVSLRGRLEPR